MCLALPDRLLPMQVNGAPLRRSTRLRELVKAGIMLVGEGLKPSSTGVRVCFSGKDRIVTDGPFAETKELVAGYWTWQVKSMDEAITCGREPPRGTPRAAYSVYTGASSPSRCVSATFHFAGISPVIRRRTAA
jgi:hypothetical protein